MSSMARPRCSQDCVMIEVIVYYSFVIAFMLYCFFASNERVFIQMLIINQKNQHMFKS